LLGNTGRVPVNLSPVASGQTTVELPAWTGGEIHLEAIGPAKAPLLKSSFGEHFSNPGQLRWHLPASIQGTDAPATQTALEVRIRFLLSYHNSRTMPRDLRLRPELM
jgi:hypothetical protein